MANTQMKKYEAELSQIQSAADRLHKDANAQGVFVIDKNGERIASSGEVGLLDTTSLAQLTQGIPRVAQSLLEEKSASNPSNETNNIHLQLIDNRILLVVIFDSKSSLGLVRLRARKANDELSTVLATLSKAAAPSGGSPLGEFTEEDIDNLFTEE